MFQAESDDVYWIEDRAAGSEVSIAARRGAIVTAFRLRGRDILYMDESTLADPAKNVRGGIPVLFPSPGKLAGDAFSYEGKTGAMKQHGFARDLPWTLGEAAITDVASSSLDPGPSQTGQSITLTLAANEKTRAAFPWDFRLALSFSLARTTLRLALRVENTGHQPMPFAFGIHPYFRVEDKAAARIATGATRAFDNVRKEVVPFRGFDLTAKELDLHLLDHGSTESALTLGDGRRIVVRGSDEFTRWVVWTVRGKDYVCLEPWTAPANALNTGESLLAVAPGTSCELAIEIEA
jgi:galactose mutarotase-like enzyme